jgi:16S rRNA (guanine527-N7)-methyltransferase
MSTPPTLWSDLAKSAGVTLSDIQLARLSRYLDLLLEANQVMNLTAIADRTAAEILHVGDALTLLPFIPPGRIKLADVGSGGGTPAIPLAIAREDVLVTCIESTGKKAAFLESTIKTLELQNVRVVASRAEDIGRGPTRQGFDVAIARAVGKMVWVAEYCLPLVKTGGKVLAMKGKKAAEELTAAQNAIIRLGGGKVTVHPIMLPGTDDHVVVEIAKTRPTPPAYPRLPSVAKGEPLR